MSFLRLNSRESPSYLGSLKTVFSGPSNVCDQSTSLVGSRPPCSASAYLRYLGVSGLIYPHKPIAPPKKYLSQASKWCHSTQGHSCNKPKIYPPVFLSCLHLSIRKAYRLHLQNIPDMSLSFHVQCHSPSPNSLLTLLVARLLSPFPVWPFFISFHLKLGDVASHFLRVKCGPFTMTCLVLHSLALLINLSGPLSPSCTWFSFFAAMAACSTSIPHFH